MLSASVGNILQELRNSLHTMTAEFNKYNFLIIYSKYSRSDYRIPCPLNVSWSPTLPQLLKSEYNLLGIQLVLLQSRTPAVGAK